MYSFLQDDLHTFGHFQTMYRMEEISKILMNSSDDYNSEI